MGRSWQQPIRKQLDGIHREIVIRPFYHILESFINKITKKKKDDEATCKKITQETNVGLIES